MILSSQVNTFGQAMLHRYGERVHKITINVSFSHNGRQPPGVIEQLAAGRQVIRKRTGARKYLAYFQAYTNTYADIASKKILLAPDWCSQKWLVLNRITEALKQYSRTSSCSVQTVTGRPAVLQ